MPAPTIEQVKAASFRLVFHLNCVDCHTSVYGSEEVRGFSIIKRSPKGKKSKVHGGRFFAVDGVEGEFKDLEAAVEALRANAEKLEMEMKQALRSPIGGLSDDLYADLLAAPNPGPGYWLWPKLPPVSPIKGMSLPEFERICREVLFRNRPQ